MGERQKRGRDERKFDRVPRFGLALPRLRARVDRDLRRKQLGRERVTACAVRLIDLQLFRVGNPRYAKKNGRYGVTTLTQRHLQTTPSIVEFDFSARAASAISEGFAIRASRGCSPNCSNCRGTTSFVSSTKTVCCTISPAATSTHT